ncbi:MAG: hypothetical protein EA421_16750, partial [Gemmatimonadales bacterium]
GPQDPFSVVPVLLQQPSRRLLKNIRHLLLERDGFLWQEFSASCISPGNGEHPPGLGGVHRGIRRPPHL